jgi:hypothetical protein
MLSDEPSKSESMVPILEWRNIYALNIGIALAVLPGKLSA